MTTSSTPASDPDGTEPSIAPDLEDPIVPRARAGHRTPKKPAWSTTVAAWAPIAAGVVRAGAGVIAYIASLLTLPLHHATPSLIGVSLVMLVGGCTSVRKSGRQDPRLGGFARGFTIITALFVIVATGIGVYLGPGAFAPDLGAVAPAAATVDDGTIRFEPG